MNARNLVVILLFSLVMRGAAVALLGKYVSSYISPYYLDLAGQIGMYLAILGLCMHQFRISGKQIRAMFGEFRPADAGIGVLLAIVLLLFTFGESAVSTLLVSHFDMALAYRLGRFHEEVLPAHPFLSIHVLSFVFASIIFPAIVEEFFFRGLLFPALASNRTYLRSAVICSVAFSILHFPTAIFINTFIFAFILCYLYAKNKSLYACVFMHATYNLLAFISQYYLNFHWTRSERHVSSVFDWIPQLGMLFVSGVLLVMLARHYRVFDFLARMGKNPQLLAESRS